MKSKKVTKQAEALMRRRYEDACGAAHGLELLGDRWALLVVRELMLGAKRFTDLRADLPGISANVLTQRLEELEASGILMRRRIPPPIAQQVYELTPWGYETEPIIQSLGRWAVRSTLHDPRLPISATSLVLSFRTMFSEERAAGFDARIGLRLGEESFLARITGGRLELLRGDAEAADVVLGGAPQAVAAAVYGGQSLEAMTATGALTLRGDIAIAQRFTTLFPLPDKVR